MGERDGALFRHCEGVDYRHICMFSNCDDLMPSRAELPRHGFNFALVESTADGIEIDFHKVAWWSRPLYQYNYFGYLLVSISASHTLPTKYLRLCDHKMI